jgi:TRAP-type uncharacterized transport system fused permease subunit
MRASRLIRANFRLEDLIPEPESGSGFRSTRALRLWERAAMIGAAILLIKPGIPSDVVGLALLAIVIGTQKWRGRAAAQ